MTDASGNQTGTTVKYLPYGETRTGFVPTDKLFTGQRLDSTGLYYYNARYYDATIGRFISPDTIIPNPANPQSFNRYSYCLNNPLKYIDPSGHIVQINGYNVGTIDMLRSSLYMQIPEFASLVTNVVSSPVYQAYDNIRKIDSYITNKFETNNEVTLKIIASNTVGITLVQNGKMTGGYGGKTETSGSTTTISINDAVVNTLGFNDTLSVLAHELNHANAQLFNPAGSYTKFEENLGDMYSSYICGEAGAHPQLFVPNYVSPFDYDALNNKYEGTPYEGYLTFSSDLNYIGYMCQPVMAQYNWLYIMGYTNF